MIHRGGCHCGAIRVEFETRAALAPRACQCTFCRRHGARTVSDPEGEAALSWSEPPILYRFASRVADYVVCRRCGIYVGAMAEIDGRRLGTLNLNAFDDPHPGLAAEPVSYDGESAEQKAERRSARWTPLLLKLRAA
jgi:hypothetical protein